MPINLDSVRAIALPYVAREIALAQFLGNMWPLLSHPDEAERQIVEQFHGLLALHSSRLIGDEALRQRVLAFVFPPATEAQFQVRDVVQHFRIAQGTGGVVGNLGSGTSSPVELVRVA
jgi:hypothetical protein